MDREPRPSSRQLFKCERFKCNMPLLWQSFKFKSVNNELGRQDLVIHTMKAKLVATWIFLSVSPPAPIPGLKHLKRHVEPSWSDPPDIECWIGECLKHQLARRVEFAHDEHFLFPWFRCNSGFVLFCHCSFCPFKLNCTNWPGNTHA